MIPSGVEIFVALDPIDLRWGFERLAGIAEEQLARKARSGALFVFFGKRRAALKILFADDTGLCLFYKRLDRGTFRVPEPLEEGGKSATLDERALDDLLDGTSIDARPEKPRRQRFDPPSEKAVALEHALEHGPSETKRVLGPSRFSLHRWQREVERASRGDGPDPTSGPGPKAIEEARDVEILAEWHRHPGLGPSQIRNQLRRRSIKVSVATVRNVMEEAGYRPPKVKRKPHDERYEACRPNRMWHLKTSCIATFTGPPPTRSS